jgi:hypothetical protein
MQASTAEYTITLFAYTDTYADLLRENYYLLAEK